MSEDKKGVQQPTGEKGKVYYIKVLSKGLSAEHIISDKDDLKILKILFAKIKKDIL